jgi:hypothetical protein
MLSSYEPYKSEVGPAKVCFKPFPVVENLVMAEILLFDHAQGETPGFLAFADELRAAGHTVHAPDLMEDKTFATLDEGVRYAKQVGFDTILERCRLAAESFRTSSFMPASRSG